MNELLDVFKNNPILSLLLLGTLSAWIVWEVRQLRRGFSVLNANQLVEWINRKDAKVLDLADNNDFLKQHIAGAVNVPLADFSSDHKAVKSAADVPVVVYDRSGLRADSAAAKLVKAGFKQVAMLDGGLDAWLRESLPTVKGR
jgi:rhodanese-related sulfurtransferase